MFQIYFKSLKLLILLFSCLPLIHGLHKRESATEENKAPSDLETLENELASTLQSVMKGIEEKVEQIEKEGIKEEEKELEKEMDKEEESNDKETGEKEPEKEPKEEPEEERGLPEEENSTTKMENEEPPSSASPMLVTDLSNEGKEKEKAPEGTYAVWNTKGKICLLARFEADFLITYPGKGGEEKADVKVNKTGIAKGKCEHTSKSPLLQIAWQKYVFTIMFNKTGDDTWVVTSMELTYDTSDTLFDRATNAGKKTARSQQPLNLFETPLSKSLYCPGEEVVFMYINKKHVVTARLKDIYLQPYGIEDGQFSPAHRCPKVVIDETLYVQDETVPLAVGCTLALITLLVLLGFSFHRAYNAAKVDYNTME